MPDRKTQLEAIAADARRMRNAIENLNDEPFDPRLAKVAIDLAGVTDTLRQAASDVPGVMTFGAER